ncbi:hypothetical protein HIM_02878 [Hirsutella minnesotensis 3608]|nr:hypothetical protein HIM_02878 [Hirsutella minnesotensis 3608]
MGRFPSGPLASTPLRAGLFTDGHLITTLRSSLPRSSAAHQIRHATYIQRPRRPYSFTQLVQLSDGSTYTMRTTSPQPIYRAVKDTRNTLMWQPSEKSLRNVELDEAGKLAAFRGRFGNAFDLGSAGGEEGEAAEDTANDGFADLITEYAPQDTGSMKGVAQKPKKKK